MKVITSTTIRVGKGKDTKYLKPGEHDLADEVAKGLLANGSAKTPAQKAADDEKAKGKASVTITEKSAGKASK